MAKNTPQTQEGLLQQQVLHHYAKTIYFNDQWKAFLTHISGFVVIVCLMAIQKLRQSPQGLGFTVFFELLSLIIVSCTILFVRRWLKPVLAFKAAFAFSLLQFGWFGNSLFHRQINQERQVGDLLADQLPFGTLYFVFCWISDRYMIRSHEVAKKNVHDMTCKSE